MTFIITIALTSSFILWCIVIGTFGGVFALGAISNILDHVITICGSILVIGVVLFCLMMLYVGIFVFIFD